MKNKNDWFETYESANLDCITDDRTYTCTLKTNDLFSTGVTKQAYSTYLTILQDIINADIDSKKCVMYKSLLCAGYIPLVMLPVVSDDYMQYIQAFNDTVLEKLRNAGISYVMKPAIQFYAQAETDFRPVSDIWVSRVELQNKLFKGKPAYKIKSIETLEVLGCF